MCSFAAVVAAACAGCSSGLKQRSQQAYRAETQELLDKRSLRIRRCYDEVLATKPSSGISGTVTIRFVVEKETGVFRRMTIDPGMTTASEFLVECVLESLRGLRLYPPDGNEARAKFRYELKPATARL
ncbi:MAG TPA: hypothetical protein VNO30_13550 [Kofleriaceae bacterium]|nr:hypothetical protein [Kofleriaceae bacterium]